MRKPEPKLIPRLFDLDKFENLHYFDKPFDERDFIEKCQRGETFGLVEA